MPVLLIFVWLHRPRPSRSLEFLSSTCRSEHGSPLFSLAKHALAAVSWGPGASSWQEGWRARVRRSKLPRTELLALPTFRKLLLLSCCSSHAHRGVDVAPRDERVGIVDASRRVTIPRRARPQAAARSRPGSTLACSPRRPGDDSGRRVRRHPSSGSPLAGLPPRPGFWGHGVAVGGRNVAAQRL